MRAKRPANASNLELFSLVKILSLSTEKAKDKPAQPPPKPSLMAAFLSTEAQTLRGAKKVVEESAVTIELCANGGHEGHDFIALYLSNDYFVFRYVGESGLPTMRQLPWYRDALRKVKSMDFNPSSQWLACVTADFSVVLIPVYFLLAHGRPTGGSMSDLKAVDAGLLSSEEALDLEALWEGATNTPSWFGAKKSNPPRKGAGTIGSISDVTVIRSASHPNPSQVTHCKWWRTWSGEDYVIIASFSGSLRFVNVRSHEVVRIKTKHPIVKLDLMIDPGKSFKYLIIHTHQGGYWQLVIENKAAFGAYDSIVTVGSTSKFEPQPLARFNKPGLRVVRQVSRGSPFVGAIDTESKRMELFDVHLSKFPVYAFRLAEDSSALRIANVTDKLLFVLTKEKDDYILSVVSRLLASVGNTPSNARQFSSAILEQFEFPPDQKPTGYFRGFGEHYYPSAKPTISIDSKDEAMESLEGFYIWTKDAIYELVPKKAPERVFCDLLASNDYKDAEAVGKTFELDVLRLYELVADQYFDLGEHGRALELYYLSGVKTSKLVSKFMAIDRADIVLTKLRSLMFHPERLSAAERKDISNTLLKCYLQRYCQSQDEVSMDELSSFLHSNSDYDSAKALTLCLEHGLIKPFLSTAHSRNMMERALIMLVNQKGPAVLRSEHFEYLIELGSGDLLRGVNDGVLIAALPPSSQLDFYLADRSSLPKSLPKIQSLLPLLDEASLLKLAAFLDPSGATFEENFALGRRPRQVSFGADKQSESSSTALTSDIATETYLFTLMTLSQVRQILGKSVPSSAPISFEAPSRPSTPSEKPQPSAKKSIVITKIACGWNHVLALSADGNVFAWGRNSHGELGLGSTEDQRSPALVAALVGHGIAHIAAGGHHSVVADSVGFTWAWGSGKRGQLGSEVLASSPLPQRVEGLVGTRVLDLACGLDFTVALTEKGLFVWGNGQQGQIPCDDPKGIVALPTKIPVSGLKIASICCGRMHTAILTTLGEVWTLGNGSNGQLGHGTSRNEDKPRLVEVLLGKTIKSVSCGSYHTIALTDLKNVYTWGSGSDSAATAATSAPHIVESLRSKNMVMVSSGDFHSVAVTESGEVFTWSSEASGEVPARSPPIARAASSSLDSPFDEVKRTASSTKFPPVSVPALSGKKIKSIVCGDHLTVVLSESGNVYSWGSGEYGQLGHGDLLDLQSPKKIDPALFADASLQRTLSPKAAPKRALAVPSPTSPSKSANGGVLYTEADLHEALRSLKGRYRHRVVIHKATQIDALSAAAALFEIEGAWAQAIASRLRLLDQSPPDPTALLTLLASLTRGPLTDAECKDKENLLFAILSAWAAKKFPPPPLEDFLRKNLDALAPTLGAIFERNSVDRPFAVEFSESFYVDLTERCVALLNAPSNFEREGKPSSERLVDQIVANMRKDLARNSGIVIQPKDIKGTRRSPDEADVIFSCGHGYTRSYLLDELAPKLQDRLGELSASLSLTSKLIVAEYHQRTMSLACPICLFNELRKGFQKPLTRWDL